MRSAGRGIVDLEHQRMERSAALALNARSVRLSQKDRLRSIQRLAGLLVGYVNLVLVGRLKNGRKRGDVGRASHNIFSLLLIKHADLVGALRDSFEGVHGLLDAQLLRVSKDPSNLHEIRAEAAKLSLYALNGSHAGYKKIVWVTAVGCCPIGVTGPASFFFGLKFSGNKREKKKRERQRGERFYLFELKDTTQVNNKIQKSIQNQNVFFSPQLSPLLPFS